MSIHVFLFFLSVSSCNAQPVQPSQFVPSRTANPFGRFDFNNQLIQSHGMESNLSSNSVQHIQSQVVRHGTTNVPFQNQERDPLFGITRNQSMGWGRHLSALQRIHSKDFQATNFERSSGSQQIHQVLPVHDSQAAITNVNSAPNNIPNIPTATIKPRTIIRVDRQPTPVFPTAEHVPKPNVSHVQKPNVSYVPKPNVSAIVPETLSLHKQIREPKKNLTVPVSQGITPNIQATSHNIDMISNIINHLSTHGMSEVADDQLMNQMMPQNIGHPTLTEPNANLLGQQFSASGVMQIQSNPIVNISTYRQNQIISDPNHQNKTQEQNNFSSRGNQVIASTQFQDSFLMQGIPIDVDDDHMSGMLANDGGVSHSAISFPVLKEVTAGNIGTFIRGLPIIDGAILPGKENNQIHFASKSRSGIVVWDIPISSDTFDSQVSKKNVTLFKTENVNHSNPQSPTRGSVHINDKSTTLSRQQQGKIYQIHANNTSATQRRNNLNTLDNYRLNLVAPHIFRNSITFQNHRVVDQSLRVNVSGNTFVNQQSGKSGQNEIDNKISNMVTNDSAKYVISTNTVIQPVSAKKKGQVNQTHAGFHIHNGSGNKNVVMSRHNLESSNNLSGNNIFNMESNSQNLTKGDNLTFVNIPFQTHLLSNNIGSVMNSKVYLDNGQVYPNQIEMTPQLPSSNMASEDISLTLRRQFELLPVTNIQLTHPKEEPTRKLKLVQIESDAGDYFKFVHPTLLTTTLISDPEAEEEEASMTLGILTKFQTTPVTTTTTAAADTTTTKNLTLKISCTSDANSLTNSCENKKNSVTDNKSMQNMTILAESPAKITSKNISKIENQNIIRRIARKLLKIVSDSTGKAEPDAIERVGAILNKEVTPVHRNIEQPLTSKQIKPQNRTSENTTVEKTGHPVRLFHKPNKELNLNGIEASTDGNRTLLEHSRKTSTIVTPTIFSLPLSFAANNRPKISSVSNKVINKPLNVKTEPVLIRLEPSQQIQLKSSSSYRPKPLPLNMQTTTNNSPSASTKIHIEPMPMKLNLSIIPIVFTDSSNKDKNSSNVLNQTRHIQVRTIRVHASEESNKERVVRQQLREGNGADNNISLLVQKNESASPNDRYGNNVVVPVSINAKKDAPHVTAGTKSISLKMKSSGDSGHPSQRNKIQNGVKGADYTTTLKQDRRVSGAFTLEQRLLSAVNTETRTPPPSQSTYAAATMGLDSIMQIQLMNNILELRNRIERAVKLKTPDRLTVMNRIRRLNHFTQTIRNTTASVAKHTNRATTLATINITTPTTITNEGEENEMEGENTSSTVSTMTTISSAGTTTENVGEIEVEAEDIISTTSPARAITATPTSTTTSETEAAEVENEMEVEDLVPSTTTVRKVYSTNSITKPITTTVSINIFANTVNQQVGSVTSSSARNSRDGNYGQSYIAPEIKVLSDETKKEAPLPQLNHSKINSTKLAAGVNKILKAIRHEKQDKIDSTKIQLQKIGDTIVIKVNLVEKVNSSALLDNRGIISPKNNTGDHSQQIPSLDSTLQTINRPSTRLKIFKEMQMKKMNRPSSTPSTFMRSNDTKPDTHQLSRHEIVKVFGGNTEKTRPHQTTTQGHNGQNKTTQGQIRMSNAKLGHGSHHNRQIQTISGIGKQNPGQDIGSPQHKNELRPKPLPAPQTQLRRFTSPFRPSQINQIPVEPLNVKVNLSNIATNNKDSNDITVGETILRSEYQHKVLETSVAISPSLHEKHGEVQMIPFSAIKRNETRPGPEMDPKTNFQKALLPNSGQKKEILDRKISNDGTASHKSPINVGGNEIQTKIDVNQANKIAESIPHKRPSSNEPQSVELLPPQKLVSSISTLTRSTPISITKNHNDENEKISQNQRSEIIKQPTTLHPQRKSLRIPFQNSAKGGKLGPSDMRENTQITQMESKDNRSNEGVKEGPRELSSEQGPRVLRLDPRRGRLSHPNRQQPTLGGGSPSANRSELKPEGNYAVSQRTTTTNSKLMQSVLSSPLRKLEEIRLKQVRGNIRSEKKNLLSLGHKMEITTLLPLYVIPVSATEHPTKTDDEGLTYNRDNYDMTTVHKVSNNLLITSENDITTTTSERRMRANRLSGDVSDSFHPNNDRTRHSSKHSVSVQRRRSDNTVQNSKPVYAMNSSIDAPKRFIQERPSVRPNRQGRPMGSFRPLIPYERRNGETNRERYTGTSLRDAFSNKHKPNEFRPSQFALNNRQNKMLPRMNLPRENPKLPTQPNVSAEEGGEEGGGAGGEGEGEGGSKTSTTTFDTFSYRDVGTSISVPYWSSSPRQSVYPHYRGMNHNQRSSRRHNNQQEWIQHRQPQGTSAWNKGQVYNLPTGNEYVERSPQDRRHHSDLSGYGGKQAQYDRSSNFNNKATVQYNYNLHQKGGTNEYQGGDRRYSSGGMDTSTLWNDYPHERTGTTTYIWLTDDQTYTNDNAYNKNNVENQLSSVSNFDHNNNFNKDRRLRTTEAERWHDTTTRVYINGDAGEQWNQNENSPTTTPSANNEW